MSRKADPMRIWKFCTFVHKLQFRCREALGEWSEVRRHGGTRRSVPPLMLVGYGRSTPTGGERTAPHLQHWQAICLTQGEMRITAGQGSSTTVLRLSRNFRSRSNGCSRTSIAAQLLVAQEAERRRVSREMHDDLAQRVALLQFEIDSMKRRCGSHPQMLPQLDSLRQCVTLLAEDVHRICERLHPVVLDNLGLVRGIEFLCADLARTSAMTPSFEHGLIPERIPANISLCLYRVVQEALNNAAKYSGASEASVSLHKEGEGLRVKICDSGRGFDMAQVRRSGLGLMFIDERVRLLEGRCAVQSAPSKGTRVSAWVPCRFTGQ
jgi:signal transduction histidine kinase